MAYRMLRGAGIAPPWIEADKDARAALGRLDALIARAPRTGSIGRERLRAAVREAVDAANRAIERVNAEAPTDRQHRRPLDPAAELGRLEGSFPAGK